MNKKYEFIIVGGGTAGCVLANRLSSNPHFNVLLINKGKTRLNAITHYACLLGLTKLSNQFSEKIYNECASDGRYWYYGTCLGGSSAINSMLYLRGNSHNYDEWASEGNKGWSYKEVLHYFKHSENQQSIVNDFHGTSGPMYVSDWDYHFPIDSIFIESMNDFGFPKNDDFNGECQEGVGFYQAMQLHGQRYSGLNSFMNKSILTRPNLKLLDQTNVKRILIENNNAIGVEVVSRSGTVEKYFCNNEVIISSGVFFSPQILMLSGIGSKASLLSERVIMELPGVGKNFQDHINLSLLFECKKKNVTHSLDKKDLLKSIYYAAQYLLKGHGPLSSGSTGSGAFIRTDATLNYPDMQISCNAVPIIDNARKVFMINGFSFKISLLYPDNRGSVFLKSTDIKDKPIINYSMILTDDTINKFKKVIRIIREAMNQPLFKEFGITEILPGAQLTNKELNTYISQSVNMDLHGVGTCAMGNKVDSVVNENLLVHGINNLRVCDASIMPTIVGGNTNAPVIMIAEKCADIIIKKIS